MVYELPFFRNLGSAFARLLLGGWEVSGISVYQSGSPDGVTVAETWAGIRRRPRAALTSRVIRTCLVVRGPLIVGSTGGHSVRHRKWFQADSGTAGGIF